MIDRSAPPLNGPSAGEESVESLSVARRAVGLAATVVLLLIVGGSVAISIIDRAWLERKSLFYEQFAAFEPSGMAILALFALAVLLMLRSRPPAEGVAETPGWLKDGIRPRMLLVAGVLGVTLLGTQLVFHGYLFIDDEYSGWFQSVLYSTGRRAVTVPPEWCQWIASLTPASIEIKPPCVWQLRYLPIHSMIRGGFYALGLDPLAQPFLAALSTLLVVLIARRAWPGRPDRAVLSGMFMAASTQFLMMSMTGFAMTAHLCFALIWLWFYVHPARWALALLPWIGVVALGVHSPYPHILFVAPFVFRFFVQRRWVGGAYVAAVYLVGAAFWLGAYRAPVKAEPATVATPAAVAGAAVETMASPVAVAKAAASLGSRSRYMFSGLTTSMSLNLFATWSVPVAMLFMLVALVLWNRLDGFSRWLSLSLLCTIVGRAFLFDIQGAGWGYRYGFAVLGNFAMLAAVGADYVGQALGRQRTYRLVAAALVVAVAGQLPLRGVQAEGIVRPYYLTSKWMAGSPADVVIFNPDSVRYGRQLIRNDPFLRRGPMIMDETALGEPGVQAVQAAFPGRVHVVSSAELRQFGLHW